MSQAFNGPTYWHWIGLGALLLIFEVTTGSGFLLWIGLSAGCIGFLLWLFPNLSWVLQWLGFGGISIVTAVSWWRYLKYHPLKTDEPLLNRRGEQCIGRIIKTSQAIENGHGHVTFDDTIWKVRCAESVPAGTEIKIVGVEGMVLIAKKLT